MLDTGVDWRSWRRVGRVGTALLAAGWLLSGCVESRSVDLLSRMHEENVALRQQLAQGERPTAPAPPVRAARKPVTSQDVLVTMKGKQPFVTCVLHTQAYKGYVIWFYGLQEDEEQAVAILFNAGMEAVQIGQDTIAAWEELLTEFGSQATCKDHAGRRLNLTSRYEDGK